MHGRPVVPNSTDDRSGRAGVQVGLVGVTHGAPPPAPNPEIRTGAGWTASLLSWRLGEDQAVTEDLPQ
jgi:hypothetical protein